eukprot:gene2362-3178_t
MISDFISTIKPHQTEALPPRDNADQTTDMSPLPKAAENLQIVGTASPAVSLKSSSDPCETRTALALPNSASFCKDDDTSAQFKAQIQSSPAPVVPAPPSVLQQVPQNANQAFINHPLTEDSSADSSVQATGHITSGFLTQHVPENDTRRDPGSCRFCRGILQAVAVHAIVQSCGTFLELAGAGLVPPADHMRNLLAQMQKQQQELSELQAAIGSASLSGLATDPLPDKTLAKTFMEAHREAVGDSCVVCAPQPLSVARSTKSDTLSVTSQVAKSRWAPTIRSMSQPSPNPKQATPKRMDPDPNSVGSLLIGWCWESLIMWTPDSQ